MACGSKHSTRVLPTEYGDAKGKHRWARPDSHGIALAAWKLCNETVAPLVAKAAEKTWHVGSLGTAPTGRVGTGSEASRLLRPGATLLSAPCPLDEGATEYPSQKRRKIGPETLTVRDFELHVIGTRDADVLCGGGRKTRPHFRAVRAE